MSGLFTLALVVFAVSVAGILVFAVYPPVLLVAGALRWRRSLPTAADDPTVSLLVVVRNAEKLIRRKIENSLALDYPPDRIEIVFYSDGSEDRTGEILASAANGRLRVVVAGRHQGKIRGMNAAIQACSGSIIVFSDGDAVLAHDAIRKLVRHFTDPDIGGVCGQRLIGSDEAEMKGAQHSYIRVDSWIKMLESRVGSITSNDGKLYAIRRELYRPIPDAVMDDAFVGFAIVYQGKRFVFDSQARAFVSVPSRNREHEVERRRRIVSCGLRGLFMMRGLLNPFRFGVFSIGVLVNKLLRRLIPVFLMLLAGSSLVLALAHPWARLVLAAQALFYLCALLYRVLPEPALGRRLGTLASLPYYFCLGSYGTLLGLIDFLTGKRVVKWEPLKTN